MANSPVAYPPQTTDQFIAKFCLQLETWADEISFGCLLYADEYENECAWFASEVAEASSEVLLKRMI